jgi:uncharacterized protein YqjF (DUF2071 family)
MSELIGPIQRSVRTDSSRSAQRSAIMAVFGAASLVITYYYTVPSAFTTDTAGTSAQWRALCHDPAQACSVANATSTDVIYRACGIEKCYTVSCSAGYEDKVCDKRELVGARPVPRKLRTIVGSIL